MAGLHLSVFMNACEDFEQAQYQVLSGLQEVRQAFSRNVIYPHLGELIKLYGSLNTIIHRLDDLRSALPAAIKDIDWEAKQVLYEKPELGSDHLAQVEELIRWALPQIKEAIDEGRTIFEFVEEHLHIEEVGIVPSYVEEGYLIVPDQQARQLHILQYTLSVFTQANERFRSLRTNYVKTLPQQGVYPSPQRIKWDLMAENRELPNPATYFFATDLDFPFEQTMLPVAKRKLMQYLFKEGGTA